MKARSFNTLPKILSFSCLFLCIVWAGCEEDEVHGAAPLILDLAYSPETATVDQEVVVTGTFFFKDPDRDIGYIAFNIKNPDDTEQEVPVEEVEALRGQGSGTVQFTLTFEPTMAGEHVFEVWVIDDTEFESNHLEGVLEVM